MIHALFSFIVDQAVDQRDMLIPFLFLLCATLLVGTASAATPGTPGSIPAAVTIPGAGTVTVDFGKSTGTVSSTFYGVNTHGVWGSSYSRIDANGDGSEDTMSDYNWHRNALLKAHMGYIRADMALGDAATGVNSFKTGTSNYGSIDTRKDVVKWAAQNNIKVLFSAEFMPTWLSDNGWYCKSSKIKCPPSDYNKWGQLVVNFLDAVDCDKYPGTCEVEVWNEPDLPKYFLPDMSETDPQRAVLYNKLYLATYNAVKAKYPSMKVGGPGTSTLQDPGAKALYRSFMQNLKGKADFFSFHEYYFDRWDKNDYDGHLGGKIMPQLMADCDQYDFDCSRLVLGEFSTYNATEQVNDPTGFTRQLALGYAYMLNEYPTTSMAYFDWSEDSKYGAGHFTGYPMRWTMVSEPKLDNRFYAPYKIASNFSMYHPAGSTVVDSKTNDGSLYAVATKGSSKCVTVVSKWGAARIIQFSIKGTTASGIKDMTTRITYPLINGWGVAASIPYHGVSEYCLV